MSKPSNRPTKSPPIPLLDAIDLENKDISADALLTQRKLAEYLVVERAAHYYFTVKGNQPTLEQDIALYFQDRKEPDFVEHTPPDHGRIETPGSGPPPNSLAISTFRISPRPF